MSQITTEIVWNNLVDEFLSDLSELDRTHVKQNPPEEDLSVISLIFRLNELKEKGLVVFPDEFLPFFDGSAQEHIIQNYTINPLKYYFLNKIPKDQNVFILTDDNLKGAIRDPLLVRYFHNKEGAYYFLCYIYRDLFSYPGCEELARVIDDFIVVKNDSAHLSGLIFNLLLKDDFYLAWLDTFHCKSTDPKFLALVERLKILFSLLLEMGHSKIVLNYRGFYSYCFSPHDDEKLNLLSTSLSESFGKECSFDVSITDLSVEFV